MIVLYRRTAPHATLRTGFAGLIRFTEWLRHRDIGVKRLVGVVDTSHCRQEGGLSDERLERFYRLAGARRIRAADVPGLAPVELHWHHSRGTTGVLDLTDFRLSRTGRRGSTLPKRRSHVEAAIQTTILFSLSRPNFTPPWDPICSTDLCAWVIHQEA